MGELAVLMTALGDPIAADGLTLVPWREEHRADLRVACAEDPAIWTIYAVNWGPDGFDANFDQVLANPAWRPFAIFDQGELVGMSAYIGTDNPWQTVEIGNTYLRPAVRGTGLNARIKRLMLARAFECGMRRVEFRVDARNLRSRAAVAKIGGVEEGILRAVRITWTGHVRDTALFSILREEWS